MLPAGVDPRKMEAMMRQMGIKQEKIEATRVIIECDGKRIIVEDPEVVKVTMQGQQSLQISGNIHEELAQEDDLKIIMEQTGCSKEEAQKALKDNNGDLAEALLALGKG
ncbi:nascent polypeptide-associated complex protein [Candidatus Micrarchaeota archaeon]|nr:nascent polypeptide-associated complex protein [Candidatus Micrarchaeota archaeon]